MAPASIYVITREEHSRAGVTSVPEALRLAPNLQSPRPIPINTRSARAARFSAREQAAGDDRWPHRVPPLFSACSGRRRTRCSRIDRIEVISGPGAALWGANAVNGVINVITGRQVQRRRRSWAPEVGNLERGASARYGAQIGSRHRFACTARCPIATLGAHHRRRYATKQSSHR